MTSKGTAIQSLCLALAAAVWLMPDTMLTPYHRGFLVGALTSVAWSRLVWEALLSGTELEKESK